MLIKLDNENIKKYLNEGHVAIGFIIQKDHHDNNYIIYDFITEVFDNNYVINWSDRCGNFKPTDDIFDLFYSDDLQQGCFLDERETTVYDKLQEHFPFGNEYYLSDGNMEEIDRNLRYDCSYVLISNTKKHILN